MPKQAKINKIKAFHCYTILEAAEIAGVSTHTVRNWSKDGLRLMDGAGPPLIRGDDLRDYIKKQRAKRRVKTKLNEFYCVKCGRARNAAENMADCKITDGRAKLTALCETCETVISKPVAFHEVTQLSQILDLTITRHVATLL